MDQVLEMYLLHGGTPRDPQARGELLAQLPDAEATEPDDVGVVEIRLQADDKEEALRRIWTPSPSRGRTTTSSSSSTRTYPSTGARRADGSAEPPCQHSPPA
jgi:hypothetical protein